MNRILHLIAATIIFAVSQTSLADTLELKNGDRLTGTVVEQGAGKITIETAYAGSVSVTTADISAMNISTPMQFSLSNGKIVRGTIQTIADGTVMVTGSDGKLTTIPSVAQIDGIGAILAVGPPLFTWRGQGKIGGNVTKGNTRTDTINVGARIIGEQKGIQRITGYANFYSDHTGDQRTKEQYLLGAKYDRFFDDKWYGYIGSDFEKNSFKDLDLRSVFTTGAGHQFWDTDVRRLSVEGGLSYVDEDFKNADDDFYLALGWGVNFEQLLLDDVVKFFHHHRGLQGLKNFDDKIINAETGISFPLFNNITANFVWGLDWDQSPPDDAEDTDHSFTFGAGYVW